MIYLTEAFIDFNESAKPRPYFPSGFYDIYAWHQAVWELFPKEKESSRNFLTRLDRKKEGHRLLIISSTEPVKPDWCNQGWKTQVIPSEYFLHKHFAFQLRVNPTKKIRVGHREDGTRKKNGKRVPLKETEELFNWLRRKGIDGGFAFDETTLRALPEENNVFNRQNKNGCFYGVDFRGILQVTDASLFQKTFIQGIGSAKAFGYGLLIITPIFLDKN